MGRWAHGWARGVEGVGYVGDGEEVAVLLLGLEGGREGFAAGFGFVPFSW